MNSCSPVSLLQLAAGQQIPGFTGGHGRKRPVGWFRCAATGPPQCMKWRFRLHHAKARPARPTSSTPVMMAGSPGLPKPGPSPLDTAPARVASEDLEIGLFQFDSVEGPAVDAAVPGVPAVTSRDGVATTRVGLGSGAWVAEGAAGWGGGGAGAGGFTGAEGSCTVGFGLGLRGTSDGDSDGTGRQISPQVGGDCGVAAIAGDIPERPIESARTPTAASATIAKSTYGDRVMNTFSRARGPLRTGLVSPVVCYRYSDWPPATRRAAPNPRIKG